MTTDNTTERHDVIAPHQDAWPFIEPHLEGALDELRAILRDDPLAHGLRALLEARYREGEREYKRDWLTKTDPAWFDGELACEVADAIIYVAMRRLLFPDVAGTL